MIPNNKNKSWTCCNECKGRGKRRRRLRKKVRLAYQKKLEAFEKNPHQKNPPTKPTGALYPCPLCKGSGLLAAASCTKVDAKNYPHLAIIGGGIGGVALAVACLHRGIPFTLYERDHSFDARSQGYGLTLQQASKAMDGFGILSLPEGITSTRHVVHTPDGEEIGEWGMRKWIQGSKKDSAKHTNIHIARQALRQALLEQLGGATNVNWNHQFIRYEDENTEGIKLYFKVDNEIKCATADLVVGADGIRSAVRRLLIGEDPMPLRYLQCMVILGICPLKNMPDVESRLLDSSTVFQTANGTERIYMMPYSADRIMWQLSFPIAEKEAKALSAKGPQALKEEAIRRTPWHSPIPQILRATSEDQISGYPVYDRALLQQAHLAQAEKITLIGDAAHPMSPFKGQGANQALLDALALAREITARCRPLSNWRAAGIRSSVLNNFEKEMIKRTSVKVKDSAEAAVFLHSKSVLLKSDAPRGRQPKK